MIEVFILADEVQNKRIVDVKSEITYLFVLMKGDPDVNFVHSLPEYEGTQCHCEVGRYFHHLLQLLSYF